MLTIPDAIKALYLDDTSAEIRRNFRVHFPNGEMADINNDQIVQESVQLTESIMSQNTFKFGLAEAPQISFETVGVGNMLGMTIECSHEIETTSLSAADIAAIQAGIWDGELVLQQDSDLGFGFFRIPLGTFVVDSCPRNHGAMTHRRVSAYGLSESLLKNDFNEQVLAMPVNASTITYDLWALFSSYMFQDEQSLIDNGWTKQADVLPAFPSSHLIGGEHTFKTSGGSNFKFTLSSLNFYLRTLYSSGYPTFRKDTIIEVENQVDFDDAADAVVTYLQSNNIDPVQSGYSDWDAVHEFFRYYLSHNDYGGTSITNYTSIYILGHALGVLATDDSNSLINLHGLHELGVVHSGQYLSLGYTASPPILNRYVAGNSHILSGIDLKFKSTGSSEYGGFTFINTFDQVDIVVGALEVCGRFGRAARRAGFEAFLLDATSPIAMSPGLYSDLWYDEYTVDGIGTVIVNYGDDQTTGINVGSGDSVYQMTDNAVLDALGSESTVQDVVDLLNIEFIPNIGDIDFIPIDMTMRGLPWVEAGDAIEVTTEDGEVVNSFILTRTLTGIQTLTDSIGSSGGDLISVGVTS